MALLGRGSRHVNTVGGWLVVLPVRLNFSEHRDYVLSPRGLTYALRSANVCCLGEIYKEEPGRLPAQAQATALGVGAQYGKRGVYF